MITNLRDPVSRRGQWRGSYRIRSLGGTADPSGYRFGLRAWLIDEGATSSDYGMRVHSRDREALMAATGDGTNRLVAVPVGSEISLNWLFPASEMAELCEGSYEASITAANNDQTVEIRVFRFVVTGGPTRSGAFPAPLPPVDPGNPDPTEPTDIVVIVDGGEI